MALFHRTRDRLQPTTGRLEPPAQPKPDPLDSLPPVFASFSRGLAGLLPKEKRNLLNLPTGPVEFPLGDLDVACAYRVLDWLVRSCLVTWLRSDSEAQQFAEPFAGAERIHDLKSATSIATAVTNLDQSLSDATNGFVEEHYSGNTTEALIVKITRAAASEAVTASTGKLMLAIGMEGGSEACHAAHAEGAISITMNVAFAKALDPTYAAAQSIATKLMGTTAASDIDNLMSQIGTLAPYAARRALGSVVAELQDSAIQLHNDLTLDNR